MAWVMTSKRYRGHVGNPPRVEFMIGNVYIATIQMEQPTDKWNFSLLRAAPYGCVSSIPTISYHSFSEALKELHRQLNSPPPEGFETYSKKQHEPPTRGEDHATQSSHQRR